ncbi:response regulator [Roseateles chitosanitabidus]|uniref:response regulator n=1 Tax=Roseateles chitosanitabidus TaxID=65048 RepID=UPI00082DB973|nr:response regulator [Roseateles chitosanitabidus]
MKIVVVEDSLTVREAILERLGEEPFLTVVGQASSPAEALSTIALSRPDAVLLDLGLRDGTHGIDVLQQLRTQGFAGYIFVLSASPYESAAFDCKARGANGFYDKGDGVERLIADLREIALGKHVEQLRTGRSIT